MLPATKLVWAILAAVTAPPAHAPAAPSHPSGHAAAFSKVSTPQPAKPVLKRVAPSEKIVTGKTGDTGSYDSHLLT